MAFCKRHIVPLTIIALLLAFAMHRWQEFFFDTSVPPTDPEKLPDKEVLGQGSGNSNSIFGDAGDVAADDDD